MVRVTGFEPAASCSQSRRATNCATPGYFIILSGWSYSPKCRALPVEPHPDIHFSAIIPRQGGKSKIFLSVVKAAFMPFSAIVEKSSKRRRHKALCRFALPCPGYRHGTPKAGATGCATPGCSTIVPWFREKIQRKFHRDGRGRICWSRADCRL